ncbi:MAG TPA: hypothetical protein DCY35_03670 [Prolixibacteraceae bacterium]|nr:hypothetical protein [Prolixibacteraceae bacterium]
MEYGKTKLIDMLTNVSREGWSRQKVKDMVDTLWRDPIHLRWSGFEYAGATDANISFNESTRVFKIWPKVKTFNYYHYKDKLAYYVTTILHEVEIDDVAGLHLIYFDADEATKKQKLFSVHNPDPDEIKEIYLDKVPVVWIYWVPGIGEDPGIVLYYGDSRHGSEWPSQVHWWNHRTLNSLRGEGLTITDVEVDRDGSLDSHAQFGITAGTAWHSDIPLEYDAQSPANLPIWYMSSGAPVVVHNPGFAIYTSGNICYNKTGSGPTAAQDDYYVMYHIFATNCSLSPIISAMGLGEYQTIGDALKSMNYEIDAIRNSFVQSNMMLIETLIFQTSSDFTNSVRSKLVMAGETEDEKVALASAATGAKTGDPGYLDDQYFDVTTVDGKKVYRPKGYQGDQGAPGPQGPQGSQGEASTVQGPQGPQGVPGESSFDYDIENIVTLLYSDETESSEHASSTDESAALKTYSLAANDYDYIKAEVITQSRVEQDASTKSDFTYRLKLAGSTIKTWIERVIAINTNGVDSGGRYVTTKSYMFAGGQVGINNITITAQNSLSNADTGSKIIAIRVYGVKTYTIGLGPQGNQGTQGAQGYQGFQGDKGDQGVQGASSTVQGPQGFQGYQGHQGIQGAPSTVQGPQGFQGFKGDQGNQGVQGAPSTVQGPQGFQGFKGDQGNQGVQGAPSTVQGPQGFQGYQGHQGVQGAPSTVQGPQGFQGFKGDQGNQGVQGAPSTVQGPQGFKGDQGAAGPQGPKGDQGAAGPQGPKGDQGAAGPQGPKGDQGAVGPQGPKGDQGSQGNQGRRGSQWLFNYSGAPSTYGTEVLGDMYLRTDTWQLYHYSPSSYVLLGSIKGEQGAQGSAGAQGNQGAQGPQGTNGSGVLQHRTTVLRNGSRGLYSPRELNSTYKQDTIMVSFTLTDGGVFHSKYACVVFADYNGGSPTTSIQSIYNGLGSSVSVDADISLNKLTLWVNNEYTNKDLEITAIVV